MYVTVTVFYGNERIDDNTPEEKSPVILFYNPKSGGYYRSRFLSDMLSSRPMCVCVDISNPNCISTLRSIVPTPQSQIIICGGDISWNFRYKPWLNGTVGWVLESITEAGWPFVPPCCVLALGTGNDLARTFRFGSYSVRLSQCV